MLKRYYSFQFFFSLLLWIPVFYEIERRLGLSDREVFAINSIYQVAFCFLEIPTGLFADLWGRKRCLVLGSLLLLAANLSPVLSPGYTGFLTLFLLLACARSFISGAASAYLYDALKESGRTDDYKGAEGNARAWSLVGRIGGWAVIGPLMEWHLELPYLLTAASAGIALVIALGFPPLLNERPGAFQIRGALDRLQLGRVLSGLVRSPLLLFVMIQGIGLFAMARIQLEVFQPVLKAKDVPAVWFGPAFALATVFEAVGAARPSWLRRWMGDLGAVFLLTTAMAGLLLALIPEWPGGAWVTLCVFCFYSLGIGFAFPIQRQLVNDAIPDSRYRATFLSLESILDRAVYAGLTLQLGISLSGGGLNLFLGGVAWGSLGLMACCFGALLFLRTAATRNSSAKYSNNF